MTWLIPAIGVPAAVLCAYVPTRVKGNMRAALLLKTTLSVMFILYALYGVLRLATSTSFASMTSFNAFINFESLTFGLFVVAGLVFGLLGDIWLDLKDIHLKSKEHYMFCGFNSFLIGHLFFMSGLFIAFSGTWKSVLLAIACGAVVAFFIFLTEKPMKLDYGKFRFISIVYAFILATAVAFPIILALPAFSPAEFGGAVVEIFGTTLRKVPLIFGLGMVSFILSDLFLSNIYFRTDGKTPPPTMFWCNYIFYYGAQFTLACSLYFLV
ncbi:MAG: lysoplasmalogenase [Oscillospiraceae bacterium]|nr:lysoplasmalogenase [Oscillospiraceae bacterium]